MPRCGFAGFVVVAVTRQRRLGVSLSFGREDAVCVTWEEKFLGHEGRGGAKCGLARSFHSAMVAMGAVVAMEEAVAMDAVAMDAVAVNAAVNS